MDLVLKLYLIFFFFSANILEILSPNIILQGDSFDNPHDTSNFSTRKMACFEDFWPDFRKHYYALSFRNRVLRYYRTILLARLPNSSVMGMYVSRQSIRKFFNIKDP